MTSRASAGFWFSLQPISHKAELRYQVNQQDGIGQAQAPLLKQTAVECHLCQPRFLVW